MFSLNDKHNQQKNFADFYVFPDRLSFRRHKSLSDFATFTLIYNKT